MPTTLLRYSGGIFIILYGSFWSLKFCESPTFWIGVGIYLCFASIFGKLKRKDLFWLLFAIIAMIIVGLLKQKSFSLQAAARQIPEALYFALAIIGFLFPILLRFYKYRAG
jgi:hypothetical protein